MKPGTRIEFRGTPAMGSWPAVPPERAVICKPRKEELPSPGPGWYVVRFEHGGKLYAHETRFRVIDNR